MVSRKLTMIAKSMVVTFVLSLGVHGDSQENGGSLENNIFDDYPDAAKRSHNMMRFGKRIPDDNHKIIHFGKRQSLGITDNANKFPELLRILRSEDRDSWKRGHNIMRFGKRVSGNHNFIHFGKKNDMMSDEYSGSSEEFPVKTTSSEILSTNKADLEKRPQHALIRFGKRLLPVSQFPLSEERFDSSSYVGNKRYPHTMIHFGKRNVEDLNDSANENDESVEDEGGFLLPAEFSKRAHSMIHFGKRQDSYPYENELSYQDSMFDNEEKRDHKLIHFGKRFGPDEEKRAHQLIHFGKRMDDNEDKRSHSLMHFGKRMDDSEDKRSHSLMHFGKRMDDDSEDKRSHSLMHFGKRMDDDSEDKRSHSLMHFGKRMDDSEDKRSHSLMHFGKRMNEEFEKRLHSMIHFGKRLEGDVDKRAHSLMHFGKRQDEEKRTHTMMHFGKRNAETSKESLSFDEAVQKTSRTK